MSPAPLLMGACAHPTSDRAPWHEEPPVTGTKPFIVTPEDEDDLPVAAPEPARPTFLSRLFSGGGGRQAEDPQAGPEEYVPPPAMPSVEEESYTPPRSRNGSSRRCRCSGRRHPMPRPNRPRNCSRPTPRIL
ncbi:hypothetical protein RAA17_03235 [Komagataeibacter rhaeticus]|nr:hypothetical protein [Komagataeibacter rhaeticus]